MRDQNQSNSSFIILYSNNVHLTHELNTEILSTAVLTSLTRNSGQDGNFSRRCASCNSKKTSGVTTT